MKKRLALSSNVARLGVTLDPKLNWRLCAEVKVEGACIAFYASKRTFVKKCSFWLKIVLCMYTTVPGPILTYGSIVWWPVLSKKFSGTTLNRIERTSCAYSEAI